jgi:hypothetical protein
MAIVKEFIEAKRPNLLQTGTVGFHGRLAAMRRRDFITLVGTAAAPLLGIGRARVQPKLPVIGFLGSTTPKGCTAQAAARQGLGDGGYFVSSLNQLGGNIAGVTCYSNSPAPKRLEIIRLTIPDPSCCAPTR